MFAFGHGLSYTTFEIADVNTDKKEYAQGDEIEISYQLLNSGTAKGAEVVQVYAGKIGSKVERALKELKGFLKTTLSAGEFHNRTITIDVNSLRY